MNIDDIFGTYHVFLDTEVFKRSNYNYHSRSFQQLALLRKYNSVSIYLTEITVREIQSNILQDVAAARGAIKSLQKKSGISILKNLRGAFHNVLFSKLNVEALASFLNDQFLAYLKDISVNLIPIEGVSITEIFEKYFTQAPPFGNANKKHEFPDAFVLSSLRNWCQKQGIKLYVVSGDSDIKASCEAEGPLIWVEKLEGFLDLVYSALEEPYYSFANDLLDDHSEEILEQIENEFPYLEFYLDEEQGKVHKVVVGRIDILDSNLVQVSKKTATFELSVIVEFQANVSYFPLILKEHTFFKTEETIERTLEIPVEVRIGFDINKPNEFKTLSLNIQEKEIGLYLYNYSDDVK